MPADERPAWATPISEVIAEAAAEQELREAAERVARDQPDQPRK